MSAPAAKRKARPVTPPPARKRQPVSAYRVESAPAPTNTAAAQAILAWLARLARAR